MLGGLRGAAVADFEAANPEENVFGDIGGVVGDAFEMTGSEYEVEIGSGEAGIFGHSGKQGFEDFVAILVHEVVAFEDLRGELDILIDESPEALGDHGADGGGHRLEIGGNGNIAQGGERNGALAQIDGEIAHAFEIVIDFQSGDDHADVGIEKIALAQHADGVLVDEDFHFVDAWLGEKNFAGEAFITFEQSPKRAIDGGLDGAGLGNEIIH